MNKLLIPLILIVFKLSLFVHCIDWQGNNWALGCDFTVEVNNMCHVKVASDLCGSTCASTDGCTHFVHVSQQGICYLKKGNVTKDDAVDNGDKSIVK